VNTSLSTVESCLRVNSNPADVVDDIAKSKEAIFLFSEYLDIDPSPKPTLGTTLVDLNSETALKIGISRESLHIKKLLLSLKLTSLQQDGESENRHNCLLQGASHD
jgi:hypothetical protein